jgi:translocation and assembly module TamB
VIDAWVADIEKLDGEVDLALRARGTLGRPQVNGAAGFTGGLEIPKAGTRLTDVKLAVEGTLAEQLRLTGHARSGDGDIDVDGELDLRDTEALSGQIKITGDQFLAVDLRDTRVLISPQLYAQLNKRDILIGGLLLVPEAHLRLSSSQSNRVNESSDVILVNGDETEQAARRKFYRVTTDLALVLGDAVQFEGYGLETGVTGAVRVSQTPGALMTGIGEINLKDGTYEAYGQKLTLESGRIFYAGGPLSRPGIDLRAVRKTGDVLAGVKVLGTVQNPTTELYSDPAMTQSETLSYLLLGRPLNRASSEEGQMLANAAVSLGLKGGNLIAEQITGTFGLDQLSFESGETYRDASMVVGKYLTPRLYIDYSVGLIDAVNRLRMHYQLSEHWSVQTEAGEEAGGDLLFSIER